MFQLQYLAVTFWEYIKKKNWVGMRQQATFSDMVISYSLCAGKRSIE